MDLKYKNQRFFRTLCHQFKNYAQFGMPLAHFGGKHLEWWDDRGRHCMVRDCEVNISHWRKCKTCKREWARHLKRSRGLNLDLSVIKPWLTAEWRQ